MKKGLVLEGGAMRGLFSAGVIDVFMENNINFDGMAGVSAGACFGCNLKSKQHGRCLRYNKRFARDRKYCSLWSLITTGDLYGAEYCYDIVPNKLDIFDRETFFKNPMEFYTVATDVETGKGEYTLHEKDENLLEYIRASASMPLVSRIVEINGRKFLDGGIADSIPLKFMESKGYEKNIVVLTQPRDFVKTPSKSIKLIEKLYKKYPLFVKAMANRHNMYNETLEYIKKSEDAGRTLVIAPKTKLPVGRIEKNPDKLQECYDIGREICLEQLDRIKKFLED